MLAKQIVFLKIILFINSPSFVSETNNMAIIIAGILCS